MQTAISLAEQDDRWSIWKSCSAAKGGRGGHAWQDGELEEIIKRTRTEVAIRYATFPMLVLMKRVLLPSTCWERGTWSVFIAYLYLYLYLYLSISIYPYISIFISISQLETAIYRIYIHISISVSISISISISISLSIYLETHREIHFSLSVTESS